MAGLVTAGLVTAGLVTMGLAVGVQAETREARKARILAPTTDFTAPEPNEMLSGGTGTNVTVFTRDAFSQPTSAFAFDQRFEFDLGQAVFDRPWVAAPASTIASDGLGPYFNARSCSGCHIREGRGHPPQEGDTNMVSMLFSLSDASGAPDPVYGAQFQDMAVTGMASEGKVRVRYEPVDYTYPDGETVTLRKPLYSTDTQLSDGVALNPRIAPPMIGLGLLQAIEDEDILAHADPDDLDGDGISGRAERLGDGALGRFGWKHTTASIMEQSALAFSNDMGLSTWVFPAPYGDCTEAQEACITAFHGDADGMPEVADELLDYVSAYSANLAVPARRDLDDPDVLAGKALFYQAGCISCHMPKHATGPDNPPEVANQLIWPYSDLLLHDMGEGLADLTPTRDVPASEWRTPPLWGIGLTETVSGHTHYLHDGRANSLEEAILWHGGEATSAREAFANYTEAERARVLRFLESL
jgi:CxxC motif-containing protein (DUF1111 family)